MTDAATDQVTAHEDADLEGGDRDGVQLGSVLRALRRRADLSQRELAVRSGVAQPTLARIESGGVPSPSFRMVERLVRAAGGSVSISDRTSVSGAGVVAIPHEELRDGAGRHYPAHLDPAALTRPEKWWGAWWAASTIRAKWPLEQVPPYTYELSRAARDERRARVARGARAVVQGGPYSLGDGRRAWQLTAEVPPDELFDDGAGQVVGALHAHDFDADIDGVRWPAAAPVPAGTVVLDGVAVLPDWQLSGIGRRLLETLRGDVGGGVIALAGGPVGRGFLEACRFRLTRALPAPLWFKAD